MDLKETLEKQIKVMEQLQEKNANTLGNKYDNAVMISQEIRALCEAVNGINGR